MRVAIIGGGFLGAELAHTLDTYCDVALIEPRDCFSHTPAMIRAAVDPTLLDRALIPYDTLLANGRWHKDHVKSLDENGAHLAGGETVAADYYVIATGSRYAKPFKGNGSGADAKQATHAIHERIKLANTIAIIGAGAVGVELAGEIAAAMPDKNVTLVTDQDRLFPTFKDSLGNSLKEKLTAMGIELIFDTRVATMASINEPFNGPLELSGGRTIDADIIVPVIGAKPNTELLETLPNAQLSDRKRIVVDGFLRPSSLPNVFAAGDAADTGDDMTIVAISRQMPWLKNTFKKLSAGQSVEQLKPYAPFKTAPILVPLGKKRGASFLGAFTAGDWVTSKMKGQDLFLTKYNKLFNRS